MQQDDNNSPGRGADRPQVLKTRFPVGIFFLIIILLVIFSRFVPNYPFSGNDKKEELGLWDNDIVTEPIIFENDFVYIRYIHSPYPYPADAPIIAQIVTSESDGDNLKVLKEFSFPYDTHKPSKSVPILKNISPKGTYYVISKDIYSIHSGKIRELPENFATPADNLSAGGPFWSSDEKYVAFLEQNANSFFVTVYNSNDWVLVSKVELGSPTGYDKPREWGVSLFVPHVSWNFDSKRLFISLESKIIMLNLESGVAKEESKPVPETCYGLAVAYPSIYCHTEMSNSFSGTGNKDIRLFEYNFTDPVLVQKYFMKGGLEGEYGAFLNLLDKDHLIFDAFLGGSFVIDLRSGAVAWSSVSDFAEAKSVSHKDELLIFQSRGGGIRLNKNELNDTRYFVINELPIRYTGK